MVVRILLILRHLGLNQLNGAIPIAIGNLAQLKALYDILSNF
jgi:hypothetical protein